MLRGKIKRNDNQIFTGKLRIKSNYNKEKENYLKGLSIILFA